MACGCDEARVLAPQPVPQGWQKCQSCLKPAPSPLYVSPASNQIRPALVEGVGGFELIQKNVCLDCYRKAFAVIYPFEVCPV